MKKLLTLSLCLILCLLTTACTEDHYVYTPTGEFYAKTSNFNGEVRETDVIDLEAAQKSYTGEGDIIVPMTVGLGHVPGHTYVNILDSFYVLYTIVEAPYDNHAEPVWGKRVDYADHWCDAKYDSTPTKTSLFSYPPFYPLYKESVEITFPAEVTEGYLEVSLYAAFDRSSEDFSEDYDGLVVNLQVYFERVDGVLTLDPHDICVQ